MDLLKIYNFDIKQRITKKNSFENNMHSTIHNKN